MRGEDSLSGDSPWGNPDAHCSTDTVATTTVDALIASRNMRIVRAGSAHGNHGKRCESQLDRRADRKAAMRLLLTCTGRHEGLAPGDSELAPRGYGEVLVHDCGKC